MSVLYFGKIDLYQDTYRLILQ